MVIKKKKIALLLKDLKLFNPVFHSENLNIINSVRLPLEFLLVNETTFIVTYQLCYNQIKCAPRTIWLSKLKAALGFYCTEVRGPVQWIRAEILESGETGYCHCVSEQIIQPDSVCSSVVVSALCDTEWIHSKCGIKFLRKPSLKNQLYLNFWGECFAEFF